jgi:hypothetical protein
MKEQTMLPWNLIPMPSLRISFGLLPEGAGGEGPGRYASRKIDEGSAPSRRSHASDQAADAMGQEPEWEGQWRSLKYL